MKQQAKSSALRTVELSKTYILVLYSSGAVMLRRTAFPYNNISVNTELVPYLDASIRDVAVKMVADGQALRSAAPAKEIKAKPTVTVSTTRHAVEPQVDINAIVAEAVAKAVAQALAQAKQA